MRGLKVFLFISFLIGVIYALLLFILPGPLADAKMGPQDVPSARYAAATYLGLATASWYAFRNPKKNIAVVRALLVIYALSTLVALLDGAAGDEEWGTALPNAIFSALLAGGLAYFHPRGEKAA